MTRSSLLLTGAGDVSYQNLDAVAFDGTDDDFIRASPMSDGYYITVSCWYRLHTNASGASNTLHIFTIGPDSVISYAFLYITSTTGKPGGTGTNPADTQNTWTIGDCPSARADTLWHHVIMSIDTLNGVGKIYLDDVAGSISAVSGDTTWFSNGDMHIATIPNQATHYKGDIADLWINNSYMDLDVASNRRKFITSGGYPVDLGSTGQNPTGGTPLVFLHLDDGETTANFGVNAGTGGDFTASGTPVSSSTTPAYPRQF